MQFLGLDLDGIISVTELGSIMLGLFKNFIIGSRKYQKGGRWGQSAGCFIL